MAIHKNRWRIVVSSILVLLFATACIRSVGDQAQGQQSSLLVTETPTATSTNTPVPTEEPTAGDVAISLNETETATPTETPTDTPTATPTEDFAGTAVAQADDEDLPDANDQEQDPFELTATQLIINATGTAVAPLTQTAAAIGDTDTPTPTEDLSLDATIPPANNNFVSGADCVHEVRAGETLFLLSRYYGVLVMDIASRNGIVNPDLVSVGQRLTIPGCGTTGALPPPTSTPSPTATQIVLFGQGGPNLGQGGGVDTTTTTTTTACQAQHTIQQRETLFQISLQYGVSVQAIANRNGITNINVIDMFDVLCIPAQ